MFQLQNLWGPSKGRSFYSSMEIHTAKVGTSETVAQGTPAASDVHTVVMLTSMYRKKERWWRCMPGTTTNHQNTSLQEMVVTFLIVYPHLSIKIRINNIVRYMTQSWTLFVNRWRFFNILTSCLNLDFSSLVEF